LVLKNFAILFTKRKGKYRDVIAEKSATNNEKTSCT